MVGQQIGPYQVLKLLGRGGMGIVYQGMHSKLEQLVAIKVLSPEFCENASMRERFVQEAKLQVKLSHPNVVNILNYLEDNRNIYLIMEYVSGENLETLLRRSGALPLAECCRITGGVLDALGFMHRQGIIHRDIKPSNIMITDSGQIKVTDFGIAKATGAKGLTRTGIQLGTVWYMSPEQIRGAQVEAGSDIYALGVTLFQMATGKVPFHSESDFDVMKAHVEQAPPDPELLNPLISPVLASIILKALAKECRDRFGSAVEFKSALRQFEQQSAGTDGVGSPRVRQEPSAAGEPAAAVQADAAPMEPAAGEHLILGRFEKRNFLILVAMAVLLLVLLTYFVASSEFFKQEKKEPQHSIPLTSVTPEATPPATARDDAKSPAPAPPGQAPAQGEMKAAQEIAEPLEKVEGGPEMPTASQAPATAPAAEQPAAGSATPESPPQLVTKGGEKSPQDLFNETLKAGAAPSEGSLDDKKKAATTPKKSTRGARPKESTTPGSAQQPIDGGTSAAKPAKGEAKGWTIIK